PRCNARQRRRAHLRRQRRVRRISRRPAAGGRHYLVSDAGGSERLDNGLRAPAYVPLTDVDPAVGQHLLAALGRGRIAAHLGPGPVPETEQQRLYVASDERVDARTIVAAAVRALGAKRPELPAQNDPLAGMDTNAEFDALTADWKIDTIAAVREAE